MMRSTLLMLLSATAGPAQAADWGDFEGAFPLYPCHDGWVACRADDTVVTPDLVRDSDDMPQPADLRVGWFDLRPSTAFSPFGGLSIYTGEAPGSSQAEQVEEPEPEPEPEPVIEDVIEEAVADAVEDDAASQAARQAEQLRAEESAQREQERRAAEEAAAAAAAAEAAQRAAAEEAARRQAELEAQAQAAADAAEQNRLRKEADQAAKRQAEAEAARRKAEEEAKRREQERLAMLAAEEKARKAEEAARLAREKAEADAAAKAEAQARAKAEADAKARAEAKAQAEAEAQAKAEEEAKRQAAAAAAAAAAPESHGGDGVAAADAGTPPAVGTLPCEPAGLVKLEPMAMLGNMDEAQIAACETALSGSSKMTDKGKISRILMVDAFSKGDAKGWERLVKRHLDTIDQSDPDMCYKYALHLSKQGPGRATGVIRWANVALENRTVWTGDTYTSRVYSLYKLRSAAAQDLWRRAEENNAANPDEELRRKVADYRAQTKVFAREWYEYAKVAGKDTTKALQLCMSAAGTADYCEAR